MLRTATYVNSRRLFVRLINPGTYVPVTSQFPKKLRPIKGMSTDCEEMEPPPLCPPQFSLMDYSYEHAGCYKEKYEKDNKKANKELILGIVSVLFALAVIEKNGMVKGYPLSFLSLCH